MRLVKVIPVKLRGKTEEAKMKVLNSVLIEIQLMYDNNRILNHYRKGDYEIVTANVEVDEMGDLIAK